MDQLWDILLAHQLLTASISAITITTTTNSNSSSSSTVDHTLHLIRQLSVPQPTTRAIATALEALGCERPYTEGMCQDVVAAAKRGELDRPHV
jgi:hypothetical protein